MRLKEQVIWNRYCCCSSQGYFLLHFLDLWTTHSIVWLSICLVQGMKQDGLNQQFSECSLGTPGTFSGVHKVSTIFIIKIGWYLPLHSHIFHCSYALDFSKGCMTCAMAVDWCRCRREGQLSSQPDIKEIHKNVKQCHCLTKLFSFLENIFSFKKGVIYINM